MTDIQYEKIFREMSFDMIKEILKYTESPSKSIPNLLDELRELTGAKVVTLFRCLESPRDGEQHSYEMLGFNPKRRKGVLEDDIYEKLLALAHCEKELILIDQDHYPEHHTELIKFGFDLSLIMPICVNDELLGSFSLLGLPTRNNLELMMKGLEALSNLFALTFKGAIFYMDMEEMVNTRTSELSESERKLKHAQTMAKMGNWELNFLRKELTWSDEIFEIYEIKREKFTPSYESFLNFVHPEDRAYVDKTFKEHIDKKQHHYNIDHRIQLKSGKIIYLHEFCETQYDTDGNPIKSIGIARDITERKIHEIEITNSEKKYRNILQTTNDGFWYLDSKGNIIDVNNAYCEMSGYSKEELLKMSVSDVEVIENPEETRQHIENLKNYGYDRFESIHARKDGSHYNIEVSSTYIKSENGGNFISFIRNITDRKQSELALKKSEERFRLLAENIPGVIYLCKNDNLWTIIYINENVEGLTGHPHKEFKNNTLSFVELYHPDDTEQIYDKVRQALNSKKPFHLNYRIKHKNGKWIWIEEFGIGIYENNKVVSIEGVLSDITARKQAEEKIRQGEVNLRNITDTMLETMSVITLDGNFLYANKNAARNMSDSIGGEIIGRNIRELLPKDQAEDLIARYRQVSESDKLFQQELEIHLPAGDKWFFNILKPIEYGYPPVKAVLSVSLDISERKHADMELENYREHLEELVAERTKEVDTRNKELESMHKVFIGREFRIKELRDQVVELKERLGE